VGQFLDDQPRGKFLDEEAPPAAAPDSRSAVTRAYDYVAKPVTSAVAKGLEIAGDTGLSPYSLKEPSEAVAKVLVPQTPLQAGAMAGTLGAGPLVSLAAKVGLPVATLAAYPWLARILGGAVGGEAAGDVSGETPGKGALVGGGGAAVAEGLGALGPLGGKLYRSTAAGKSAIAAADAARVGTAMGEVAPTLKPGTTAPELQRTAEGQGLARMGAAKEGSIQGIEAALPSGQISVPALGGAISLRDANDKLSEIGARAFSKNPLDRTVQGVDQRQLYGQLANEIRAGIAAVDPGKALEWDAAQAAYAAGRGVLKPLMKPQAFTQGEFNVPALQKFLTDPRNRAVLAKKLGGDLGTGANLGPYNRLVDSITRNAEPGMVDQMSNKPLGLMDTSGSGGAVARGFRLAAKAFPNASSRYVGDVPFSTPPLRGDLQTMLDLMGERAAAR